jgi:hypothetical protein
MAEGTDQTPGKRLESLRRLWAVRLELAEKLAAIDAEIHTVLEGEETIAQKLKRLYRAFSKAWELRYGAGYVMNFQIEGPLAKRMLTRGLTVEDIEQRAIRYIRRDDDFLRKRRHDFQLFAKMINELTDRRDMPALVDADETDPPPADCTHGCRTGAEHTRRRNDELRAPGR